jgi:hypothetical protein
MDFYRFSATSGPRYLLYISTNADTFYFSRNLITHWVHGKIMMPKRISKNS